MKESTTMMRKMMEWHHKVSIVVALAQEKIVIPVQGQLEEQKNNKMGGFFKKIYD